MFCRICNAVVVGKGLSVSEQLVGTLCAASRWHIPFATLADAARCVPTISCFCVCKAFAMRIGITNSESTVERDCKSRRTGGIWSCFLVFAVVFSSSRRNVEGIASCSGDLKVPGYLISRPSDAVWG